MIALHNGDCLEFMKGRGDGEFDLAIVDPPYGIGEGGGRRRRKGERRGKVTRKNPLGTAIPAKDYMAYFGNDKEAERGEYFTELFRVSKNQIIFGANHFISKIPYDSPCWIVWDKNNNGGFADCELAWTSFKTAVRKFKYTWNGMLQEDMANKEERIHPNQKPVGLYRWLISNYSEAGDRILDTHLGSGSSVIAAYYLQRDITGIDIDEHYFGLAKARIDQLTKQGDFGFI